jgi:Methylenetetrahydrofolate reductase
MASVEVLAGPERRRRWSIEQKQAIVAAAFEGTRAERFYRANGWTAIGKNRKGAVVVAKADAGARFLQTQFCMDLGVVRRWTQRLDELGLTGRLKVLIGIAPLASARSARRMRARLYGTIIPDALIERLDKAADPYREGINICTELLHELAAIPSVAGAHIMAPANPDANSNPPGNPASPVRYATFCKRVRPTNVPPASRTNLATLRCASRERNIRLSLCLTFRSYYVLHHNPSYGIGRD